jgi:hypothetical protein
MMIMIRFVLACVAATCTYGFVQTGTEFFFLTGLVCCAVLGLISLNRLIWLSIAAVLAVILTYHSLF